MAEAPSSPSSAEISDEFDFETRSVLLNFLGLVPSNILDQSFSSRGTSSADSHRSFDHGKHSLGDSGPLSSLPKDTLSGKVNRLGSTDDDDDDYPINAYGYGEDGVDHQAEDTVDTFTPRGDIEQKLKDLLISRKEHDEIDNMRPKLSKEGHKLQKHASFDIKPDPLAKRNSEDSAGRRRNKGHSIYMSPQRPNHIPVRSYLSMDASGEPGLKHSMERVSPGRQLLRRDSDFSEGSEITVSVQSSRSSYVDVQTVDLDPLVKSNLINPDLVPLKEELRQEKQELEENFNKSHIRTPGTAAGDISPEAAVAQYLCILGDEVQEKYSSMLNRAFQSVMNRPVEELTYQDLQAATQNMTGETSGWTKVALMMVFSKKLTFQFLSTGGMGVRKVTDFTAKLIEDTAASFIISKGGWHAITELELTPCTPSDVLMQFPRNPPDWGTPEDGAHTVTGTPADLNTSSTPADYTSSTTLDEPSDHDDREELPADNLDQPDAAADAADSSDVFSRTLEEEAADNISRIRPDIPFWRQQSSEYSRHMEEEKQRYEDEQRLWRRFKYMAFGTLAGFGVALFVYKKYGSKS